MNLMSGRLTHGTTTDRHDTQTEHNGQWRTERSLSERSTRAARENEPVRSTMACSGRARWCLRGPYGRLR